MKLMFRPKNKVGIIGEETAAAFLMKHGFKVLNRNYWKKWGEIDIVAKKDSKLRFIEVKTVSCENLSRVLAGGNGFKPEDNIHPWKLKKMSRTIESYLVENGVTKDEWQIDTVAVFIEERSRQAKIRMIENIVF